MIRILKTKTPPKKLTENGVPKAAEHLASYNSNPLAYQTGKQNFEFSSAVYADTSVKETLIQDQHSKCCFCERLVGDDGDVEHFRPKSAYRQKAREKLQRPGYFWLTYQWENLYLSCSSCNQRHKQNLFPIADPLTRAHLHNYDISKESSLIIDPGKEDPSQQIGFRGENPYPIPDSLKGFQTIKILGLDRQILNIDREKHLKLLKILYDLTKIAATDPENIELQELAVSAEETLQNAASDKGEFTEATRAALETQFEYVL